MNPKICSRPFTKARRSSINLVRCSMLPFDKGGRNPINILVRYEVLCQCPSNCHLGHCIRLPLKPQSTCFDGRPRMEPWRQDMMGALSNGRRENMRRSTSYCQHRILRARQHILILRLTGIVNVHRPKMATFSIWGPENNNVPIFRRVMFLQILPCTAQDLAMRQRRM